MELVLLFKVWVVPRFCPKKNPCPPLGKLSPSLTFLAPSLPITLDQTCCQCDLPGPKLDRGMSAATSQKVRATVRTQPKNLVPIHDKVSTEVESQHLEAVRTRAIATLAKRVMSGHYGCCCTHTAGHQMPDPQSVKGWGLKRPHLFLRHGQCKEHGAPGSSPKTSPPNLHDPVYVCGSFSIFGNSYILPLLWCSLRALQTVTVLSLLSKICCPPCLRVSLILYISVERASVQPLLMPLLNPQHRYPLLIYFHTIHSRSTLQCQVLGE